MSTVHYLCSVLCLSTHLSSRFRHVMPYPCVCPALLIVCPALIVFTCLSSSCVYSLCDPVFSLPVRPSFFMFLSFQTPHSLPHVCSIWLIVCSSLIVYTCSSSPCVFSLCVPVSRCQFVFVSPVSQEFQRFPMISTVLTITTLACVIDSVIASSLPVPLPPQPSTWITTLDCVLDSVIASSLPVPLPLPPTT